MESGNRDFSTEQTTQCNEYQLKTCLGKYVNRTLTLHWNSENCCPLNNKLTKETIFITSDKMRWFQSYFSSSFVHIVLFFCEYKRFLHCRMTAHFTNYSKQFSVTWQNENHVLRCFAIFIKYVVMAIPYLHLTYFKDNYAPYAYTLF